jgi:hypothetical protein
MPDCPFPGPLATRADFCYSFFLFSRFYIYKVAFYFFKFLLVIYLSKYIFLYQYGLLGSLLCWVWGLHCGIYKSSYSVSNISYLNSPSPLLSFILPSPHSWNSFNRYHFCIYIHVYTFFCTIFTLLPPFLPPSPSHWYQPSPPEQDLFHLSVGEKRKQLQFCLFEIKVAT